MQTSNVSRGFRVSGLVQGVGFRYWTIQQAARLGLRGYVRNEADGTVEVVAVGSEDGLRDLHRLLRQGPGGARVTRVEMFDAQVDAAAYTTFEARR